MVKTKKGKKEIVTNVAGAASSGDENETEAQTILESDTDQDNVSSKNKKNQQKQSKKSKKNRKDSIDDAEGEVGSITSAVKNMDLKTKTKGKQAQKNKEELSEKSEDDNGDEDLTTKGKNKKGKKKAAPQKSAFELLMDDDDDDDNDLEPQVQESDHDDTEEETKTNDKKNKNTNKKGKKAKRKGKDDDDEDLDKVLAELQAEYADEKPESTPAAVVSPDDWADEEFNKKKNKKAQKVKQQTTEDLAADELNDEDAGENEGGTVKTAAQKKKEKKERQKREAALAKQRAAQEPKQHQPPAVAEDKIVEEQIEDVPVMSVSNENDTEAQKADETETPITQDEDGSKAAAKNKKKSKKDKKAEEEESKKDSKKKGVSAAMVAAMQERLKKIKEEEERQRQLEEERIRQEDERERLRLEAIRLEAERKEKKKQKEAERKARLKAEGKLLTKKQKEERARAQAMLDALKAQGLEIPDPAEKRPARPGTRIRPKKKGPGNKEEQTDTTAKTEEDINTATESQKEEEKVEIVKESWDVSDSEGDVNGDEEQSQATSNNEEKSNEDAQEGADEEEADSEDEDSESESDDESESEKEEEDAFNPNDPEARRLRAEARIIKRQEDAEKQRTTDDLRAAVVCVLGHVDTGKTKILDKLRRTHVQDSEAGGITQQIGATNVPIDAIKEQSKIVRNGAEFEHKLPGLLIIDTPGHESFSNLRNRGSSLCDIAILVVDIMHGLEPQTIESINLLKKKKCPFIVALNKIDRLYDWKVMARRDIRDVLKEQQPNTMLEFEQRAKEVILQFAEQGLNAALFYENPDPKTYVSLVPTSAITGEGMGNLLFLIVEFCQKMLAKRLMYSEELQAIVLEVKAIPGLGTTIDAILINGKLREGQTMILAGTDGPIVTQIRSLLMPQPMKELRVKNAYVEHKEVKAAQGVKIAAKELEKAIAGINLLIAHKPDEVEICREEVAKELKSALSHIKLAQTGVYVQASTLGSLEALLEFLRTSKIPLPIINP
ncbi:eukaryotic translation initiation factor 5B [Teleopsis dalmanni]|uniref:eukaryotic translation initiation factor 5B n=1 Tax=Teleopsis dalmanni TaxID=139649 RepID=UPI0018CD883A|nr:eukaryotic translation initiation factor 5B [Teleopsis dalmanni]